MKISLLQPKIERGNIYKNLETIQGLIDKCNGDLIVLPEYALTGSLVLEANVNIDEWIIDTASAISRIKIPKNKYILMNSLKKEDNYIYNCCELMPTQMKQYKVYPDDTEIMKGIAVGKLYNVFELLNKKFKVLICMDLKNWKLINTEDLDFVLFIYHFTKENYNMKIAELKEFVDHSGIPILASSLVSDKNNGCSTYISKDLIISIPEVEGILEVDL